MPYHYRQHPSKVSRSPDFVDPISLGSTRLEWIHEEMSPEYSKAGQEMSLKAEDTSTKGFLTPS